MRLFIGVDLSVLHLAWLEEKMLKLQRNRALENVRWQRRDQLHITLRFLGECRDDQRAGLRSAIKETADNFRAFRLSLGKISNLGGTRGGVIVASVEKGEAELKEMAAHLQIRLKGLGFSAEARSYHGHVTLARTRGRDRLPRLAHQPPQDPSPEAYIDKLVLFQSKLSATGSTYERLITFPLLQ